MALYTRKQYEEDCQRIDKQMALSASLLGERLIGPLQHDQRCRTLEECKRKLGMKLALAAISIADKAKTAKHPAFAWVIGAKKNHQRRCNMAQKPIVSYFCNCQGDWFTTRANPVYRHATITHGNWVQLNPANALLTILNLEAQGITVMEVYPKKKLKSDTNLEDMPVGEELLPWEEVDKETAEQREQEGTMVVKMVNGKEQHLWLAHWMIRREGEPKEDGSGVRYFVARVG